MVSRTDSETSREEFRAVARLYREGHTWAEACRAVIDDELVAEIMADAIERHLERRAGA